MIRHVTFVATLFLMLTWVAVPSHAATTQCSYQYLTGTGPSFLSYCVTANGNILQIQTPSGVNMSGVNGEGYGVCDQNIQSGGRVYYDYGAIDSGNWGNAVVLSHSSASVKVVRTTADGNWTLTQTITKVPKSSSITVVMALKNNQTVSDVAYLVRYVDADPPNVQSGYSDMWAGGLNSALVKTVQPDPNYGFQLSNVGNPPSGFYWQGFAQFIGAGPNPCAFAFNEPFGNEAFAAGGGGFASIEMAYVGTFAAGQTQTITVSYHAL